MATQPNNLSVARVDLNALDLQRREAVKERWHNWYLLGTLDKFLQLWDPLANAHAYWGTQVDGVVCIYAGLWFNRLTSKHNYFLTKKGKNVTIKHKTKEIFNKLHTIYLHFLSSLQLFSILLDYYFITFKLINVRFNASPNYVNSWWFSPFMDKAVKSIGTLKERYQMILHKGERNLIIYRQHMYIEGLSLTLTVMVQCRVLLNKTGPLFQGFLLLQRAFRVKKQNTKKCDLAPSRACVWVDPAAYWMIPRSQSCSASHLRNDPRGEGSR